MLCYLFLLLFPAHLQTFGRTFRTTLFPWNHFLETFLQASLLNVEVRPVCILTSREPTMYWIYWVRLVCLLVLDAAILRTLEQWLHSLFSFYRNVNNASWSSGIYKCNSLFLFWNKAFSIFTYVFSRNYWMEMLTYIILSQFFFVFSFTHQK